MIIPVKSKLVTLITPLDNGAAAIWLKQPVPARCCDGHMVYLVINRDGRTRCVSCDPWQPK